MKKFWLYAVCWAIALAVFNVVCFVTPNEVGGMSKFAGAFWPGYICITVAFIGQLVCAYIALHEKNAQKRFYRLPLIAHSWSGLITTLVIGGFCMATPYLPVWAGIVFCLMFLGFMALKLVAAGAAGDAVSETDDRIRTKTAFIRTLTAEAEQLTAAAKTAELKAAVKKVAEAVRYSDPMSDAALTEIEGQIQSGFADLQSAVAAEDAARADAAANALLLLIDARARKCKLLK